MKIKPQTYVLVGAIIISAFITVKTVYFPAKSLPPEFSEARLRAASLAQKIVTLSNDSLKSLEEVAQYDKQDDSSQALILISRQIIKNRDNHDATVQLSSYLERMARSLPDIKPAKARQIATEAVTTEVALVSRLLTYSDYLAQLFDVLRAKFNNSLSNPDGRVEELIRKINQEAEAINDLDTRFNDAIAQFDKLFL